MWWVIDSCPVPDGYDPSLVGPSIHLALEKLGYRGPVTITAVGKLKSTSQEVLRAISSTGIIVKYNPCGRYVSLSDELYRWQRKNPAPATVMIISGSLLLEVLSGRLQTLQDKGYNILLAFRSAQPRKDSKFVVELRWKSILKDAMSSSVDKLEARRQVLQQECSSSQTKSELCDAAFACALCDSACQSIEEFTTHREGLDHQVKKLEHGANAGYLDSLSQDMLEKKLEELESNSTPAEDGKKKRSNSSPEDCKKKRTKTLLAKKKKWEELKKMLKDRDQLEKLK